jgi:hypothetical protein
LSAAGPPTPIAVVVRDEMTERRFPPPWSVDEADPEMDRRCFIVRDADGQALAYVFFEGQLENRSASSLLTRDEARRIAANIAKLPERGWTIGSAYGQH